MKLTESLPASVRPINSELDSKANIRFGFWSKPGPWANGSKGTGDLFVQLFIIALKAELRELTQIERGERTPVQRNRIKEIKAKLKAIR